MTVLINAVSGTGLVQTSDGSGVVKLQSNGVTTNALAWVNFNGASSAINQSYNVSSVTRTATGNYTVYFTNALTNSSYCVVGATPSPGSATSGMNTDGQTTTYVNLKYGYWYSTSWYQLDSNNTNIVVFGN